MLVMSSSEASDVPIASLVNRRRTSLFGMTDTDMLLAEVVVPEHGCGTGYLGRGNSDKWELGGYVLEGIMGEILMDAIGLFEGVSLCVLSTLGLCSIVHTSFYFTDAED